jgi:hypothetical protein
VIHLFAEITSFARYADGCCACHAAKMTASIRCYFPERLAMQLYTWDSKVRE